MRPLGKRPLLYYPNTPVEAFKRQAATLPDEQRAAVEDSVQQLKTIKHLGELTGYEIIWAVGRLLNRSENGH